MTDGYDALVLLSFGGPEKPEDVEPFLQHVLRGRNVPPARLAAVAEHYQRFGGRSPINDANRRLLAELAEALPGRGIDLPWYWGNRNWHPFLADTLSQMRADGVKRALVFVTSGFSSYSSCRQYLEDMDEARQLAGAGAPALVKLRPFFNHPAFIDGLAATLQSAQREAGQDAPVIFSAHSIPVAMAARCDYQAQLTEAARLVADARGLPAGSWSLAFQSRSGPPGQPWLEPDIRQLLPALAEQHPPGGAVVVVPIGFVSDHMEVVYDLDTELADDARRVGVRLVRAPTVGSQPRFVDLVGDLISEQLQPGSPILAVGSSPPWPAHCRAGCCPPR